MKKLKIIIYTILVGFCSLYSFSDSINFCIERIIIEK